jgi:hypothetical protein
MNAKLDNIMHNEEVKILCGTNYRVSRGGILEGTFSLL